MLAKQNYHQTTPHSNIDSSLDSEIKKYDEFEDSESNTSYYTVNSNSGGSFKNGYGKMSREE
jgi:hypothetical protein